VRENTITWTPLGPTQQWLSDRLLQMYQEMTGEQNPRVLVRLKLMGNFIWGPDRAPRLYLDGDGFGTPGGDNVDLRLPSGNSRRGGDFQMWFWLGRQQRRIPVIGFIPGRQSRFFAAAVTAPGGGVSGKDALQLAIERSSADLGALLPAGYEVDATQRFNPAEAAVAARRIGVRRIAGFVSDRFDKLGTFLAERLQGTLRVEVAIEVLPDELVLERVKAGMAAGGPPDFVLGDEPLSARLQEMEYSTDFIAL
jgi:hypothetical protein